MTAPIAAELKQIATTDIPVLIQAWRKLCTMPNGRVIALAALGGELMQEASQLESIDMVVAVQLDELAQQVLFKARELNELANKDEG